MKPRYDYFYFKEHLFLVSELLRENLYEFGKFVRESGDAPYFTLANLKKIAKQMLEALAFVHTLGLIHCDVKVRFCLSFRTAFRSRLEGRMCEGK